jgi:DNA-directed RNA polymerase subunit RPC12/RpoP
MRTYWCNNCEKCVDIDIKTSSQCKCGYEFINNFKTSNHVNMRTTWSGQTQVEFSQTTMDKDIAERNAR